MSDKIACIIIEDEPLAARILTDYIAQTPFLHLKETFKDALLATEYLREHRPDLIFLDIHLPTLKGMAFLKTLTHPPAVIITTAYHEYAIQGFELNVTDYLLKPFEFERFLVAVNKVTKIPREMHETRGVEKDHLFISVQKKRVKVLFSDILYVESQKEYIRIVTTNGNFLSKMGTREIESILPASSFKRIHRSFIVSLSKIHSYTSEEVEVNGVHIPIGRGYKEVLSQL